MPTIEERADYLRDHHGTYRSALIAILAEFYAYKREVSDSVEHYLDQWRNSTPSREVFACQFGSFILPKPVDPLVEAIREASVSDADDGDASRLRAALAKRGLNLVEVGDAD